MKLDGFTTGAAEVVNTSESVNYTIEATSKMFSILSSGVYQHKIRAVIRELCCNAIDSHVESGQPDRPIKVHLPTPSEPFFEVTDYGAGMSPDEIFGVYTKYGNSTKTSSNAVTGALGIGSKSPFCYTNSFTVQSIKDGFKGVYIPFIDTGIPKLTQVDLSPTTEPNGVSVMVPVRVADIATFTSDAQKVFQWLKVPPICNVRVNIITLDSIAPMAHGKTWAIYNNYALPTATLVQGSVGYDIHDLHESLQMPHIKELIQDIGKLIITVPLGTVNVAASRERLQFDRATILMLTEIVEDISNNLLTSVKSQIKNSSCDYDAAAVLLALNAPLRNLYLQSVGNKVGSIALTNSTIQPAAQLSWNDLDISVMVGNASYPHGKPVYLKGQRYNKSAAALPLLVVKQYTIVINTMGTVGARLLSTHIKTAAFSGTYFVLTGDRSVIVQWLELYGLKNSNRIVEVDKLPADTSKLQKYPRKPLQLYKIPSTTYLRAFDTATMPQAEDDVIFIPMRDRQPCNPFDLSKSSDAYRVPMIRLCNLIRYLAPEVEIRAGSVKLKIPTDWSNVLDFWNSRILPLLVDNYTAQNRANIKPDCAVFYNTLSSWELMPAIDMPLLALIRDLAPADVMGTYTLLTTIPVDTDFSTKIRALHKAHPLLKHMNYSATIPKQHILEYINRDPSHQN